jgi:hypothetical protein
MVTEADLEMGDGRTLHVYDTCAGNTGRLPVFYHHGTPNIGRPPARRRRGTRRARAVPGVF